MACINIDNILGKFNTITDKPVKFLAVQNDIKDDIKNLVKSLYDYTKTQEKVNKKEKKSALSELIVQDFDEEQIWQQIELQNSGCWDQLVWDVANNISKKNELEFPVTTSQDELQLSKDQDSEEEDEQEPLSEEQSDIESENDEKLKKSKKSKPILPKSKVKPSIVDDNFFKLQEMEKFLLSEEKSGGKKKKSESDSDDESIDMFDDIDDDSNDEEGGKEAMYTDFFDNEGEEDQHDEDDHLGDENGDLSHESAESEQETSKKNSKKVRFAAMDDESTADDDESVNSNIQDTNNKLDNEKKSDFELRQQRLKQTIDRLEQKTLSEAPWQLKGEVDATKRPQNSLLEEVVDFDLTSRPAPIITEQTTITLEDIIKRRIKDKAYDDVEKKEKPVDNQLSFRKTEILDHAKSKLSLAQVYEAEYLKQKQKLSGEVEEEKEPEAHTEIRNTMTKLFTKLDALCHYHYTPTVPQADVKIVSNTPAISMEEVAPVATSDAALLAPEEVKKKQKGDLMSKEERSKTDKNRERRKKKKFQREKGGKVTKVMDNRNTQKGKDMDNKSLKTSKAFFQQLNDDSTSLLKKRNVKNKGQ